MPHYINFITTFFLIQTTDDLDMFMVSLNELSTKVDTMQYDNLQSTIETNKQIDSLIARLITVTEGRQSLKSSKVEFYFKI